MQVVMLEISLSLFKLHKVMQAILLSLLVIVIQLLVVTFP